MSLDAWFDRDYQTARKFLAGACILDAVSEAGSAFFFASLESLCAVTESRTCDNVLYNFKRRMQAVARIDTEFLKVVQEFVRCDCIERASHWTMRYRWLSPYGV
eukprot:1235982-Karenia_brevis.AAC.1